MAAGCRPVIGHETGAPVTEGCSSPIGFCSGGDIVANRGLKGTVLFVADSIAPGPATQPGWMSYAGNVTITTTEGTLSGRSLGIYDADPSSPTTNAFVVFDAYQTGTGRFEGVTGQLYAGGTHTEAEAGGPFPVSGELCFPE
jgi:hypothetical protein